MFLALELYNRPSLVNRLDGFTLLFCTAWEQLAKAMLIERDGEGSIFKTNTKRDRPRETISLRNCLELLYEEADPIRRNVERIKFYRDHATHLLMPEVQAVLSRLFQSAVLNYTEVFSRFADQPFMTTTTAGLMTLVGDLSAPTVARLRSNYGGEIGQEVFDLARTLEQETLEADDVRFAVPIDIKLVFAKKGDGETWHAIANAEEGIEGLRKAVVVEKPVDHQKTHPYPSRELTSLVNERVRAELDEDELKKRLPARNKASGVPELNQHCINAVMHRLGWRNSNNRYHYATVKPVYRWYSEDAVDEIVRRIRNEPEFLRRCREDYSRHLKRQRTATR